MACQTMASNGKDNPHCRLFALNMKRVLLLSAMPEEIKKPCLDNGMSEECRNFADALLGAKMAYELKEEQELDFMLNEARWATRDIAGKYGLSYDFEKSVGLFPAKLLFNFNKLPLIFL